MNHYVFVKQHWKIYVLILHIALQCLCWKIESLEQVSKWHGIWGLNVFIKVGTITYIVFYQIFRIFYQKKPKSNHIVVTIPENTKDTQYAGLELVWHYVCIELRPCLCFVVLNSRFNTNLLRNYPTCAKGPRDCMEPATLTGKYSSTSDLFNIPLNYTPNMYNGIHEFI